MDQVVEAENATFISFDNGGNADSAASPATDTSELSLTSSSDSSGSSSSEDSDYSNYLTVGKCKRKLQNGSSKRKQQKRCNRSLQERKISKESPKKEEKDDNLDARLFRDLVGQMNAVNANQTKVLAAVTAALTGLGGNVPSMRNPN